MDARVLHHEITNGEGATIVLVPGGLTGIRSFDPVVPMFAERGFRVVAAEPIANELGGRGEVGDPSYDAAVERESLRRTIEQVASGEAVHLVGWSNGGRACLGFAGHHPELVATVTAVEPAAFWLSDDPGAVELGELISSVSGRPVPDDVVVAFLENVRVAPPGTELTALPQWPAWRAVANTLGWYPQAMFETAPAELVPEQVTAPVLLARGTWTAPWLREVVDVLAGRLPQAEVVELEGGHACLVQSAADFVAAASAHIARHA